MITNLHYNVQNEDQPIINRRVAALCALFVAMQFRNAIEEQRYRNWWEPLTRKYLAYKARKGQSLKIWEATGHLKNSIKAYWSGSKNAFVVGINPLDRHPGPHVVIGMRQRGQRRRRFRIAFGREGWYTLRIARTLEFGSASRNIPARPLFRRVANEFRAVARATGVGA